MYIIYISVKDGDKLEASVSHSQIRSGQLVERPGRRAHVAFVWPKQYAAAVHVINFTKQFSHLLPTPHRRIGGTTNLKRGKGQGTGGSWPPLALPMRQRLIISAQVTMCLFIHSSQATPSTLSLT